MKKVVIECWLDPKIDIGTRLNDIADLLEKGITVAEKPSYNNDIIWRFAVVDDDDDDDKK